MEQEFSNLARKRAALCKVFGNRQRVMIVWLLCERELSVSDIAERIEASIQNTSQHLNMMKDKGVLSSRRDGREIYYQIVDDPFIQDCPIVKNHPHLLSKGDIP